MQKSETIQANSLSTLENKGSNESATKKQFTPVPKLNLNPLLRTQCIICAVLLAAVVLLGKISGTSYQSVRSWYDKMLNQGTSLVDNEQLVTFVASVVEDLKITAEEWVSQSVSDNTTVTSTNTIGISIGGLQFFRFGKARQGQIQPLDTFWISSPYGWRKNPLTGKKEFHNGCDLAAPEGSGIKSIQDGIVQQSGYSSSYGNYLVIHHADGTAAKYCHMQYIYLRQGQSVFAGQVVGTVGQTGQSTGPHLHLEWYLDTQRQNPAEYLEFLQ